ncbi:hypothetical protein GWK36_06485 [Caldichromatium japonicum]|uniref:Uncharacterized protein n=1 Tax=Caldichromatium japonicum TaxID=2699430 RepID=A0A6G7VCS4_9GAMM|nr:hypothetical protein [Caldichromatium japonicum]QIK37685.1 hypothetical protein GWK36_06485 [Caldichromatium japonicum]
MGQGVGDSLAILESPPAAAEVVSADRLAIEMRVRLYLEALGVQASDELDALAAQVNEKVEFRSRVGQLGEPLEAAIEEVHLALDRWLLAELDIDNDPDRLSAARAAVLSGQIPGWTRRWAGLSDTSLSEIIAAGWIAAVPERAPLTMDPNPIDLCCHRLVSHLLAEAKRLIALFSHHRRGLPGT